MQTVRCAWPGSDLAMIEYHDEEWGVPVHDDRKLFEFLVLDAFQAGLSWRTVLHKRKEFERAFVGFDVVKVSNFTPEDIERLMNNAGIIRNRQKIQAAIANARALLTIQEEFGSFDAYIWQFVGGKTKVNAWSREKDVPATSPESDTMSQDLKKRGFSFVGSTICYAFMQASGMVNDHTTACFRYKKP